MEPKPQVALHTNTNKIHEDCEEAQSTRRNGIRGVEKERNGHLVGGKCMIILIIR